MTVDVVVVTYQSADHVGRCVECARACPQVGRVIVVDNASTDGSAAAAAQAGADLVIEGSTNVGFARGVNRGLKESTADHVLLLNPDTLLSADALDTLARALQADPEAVMAGPMLRSPDGGMLAGGRRFSTVANRLLWHLPLPVRPAWSSPEYLRPPAPPGPGGGITVDYLWGAALLCRRWFLDEIGGLDERFFLYSEDEDLGRQARGLGRRCLLVPSAVVNHVGGASTSDAALAQARVEASTALLLEKWDGPRAAALFRTAIGPALAMRAALLSVTGRRDGAALAWRTAYALLRRRVTLPTP